MKDVKQQELEFKADTKYFDEIKIVRNFLPDELYERLLKKYKHFPLTYGWKSHNDNDPHGHWNVDLTKFGRFNLANVEDRLGDLEREVWDYIKTNYEMLSDQKLIRCYINGHTFGVDGYYHRDSFRQDETTTVMYLTDEWDVDWGGETLFVNDDPQPEVVRASIPARNAAVMFNGNIKHCGRGVSRKYLGIRIVYVMKGRKTRSDNFERLSTFLYKNGGVSKRHGKGTLHDHLMGVYQLLEDKQLDADTCFAGGLHSVFGTNTFKNSIFTDENIPMLMCEFGERPVMLAKFFSVMNRPNTLETPVEVTSDYVKIQLNDGTIGGVDTKTFEDLRYIEAANMFDQKMLSGEKYPNLRKLWFGKIKDQDDETNK